MLDIYAFGPAAGVTPKMVAALPAHVNGVSLAGLGWKDLQPTPTTFNWAPLDAVFTAVGTKKKVYPRIEAGMHSPAWLPGQVTIPASYFGGLNAPVTEPNPADPRFLKAWCSFIAAFGARYANHPQLAQVCMCGPAHQGETVFGEARWPGWVTTTPVLNAISHEASWKTVIDAYRAAFPNVPTTLGIDPEPWPGHTMIADLIAYCKTKYGAKVRLQQNGLRSTTSLTGKLATELHTASAYTAVGWQEYLGGGQSGPLSGVLGVAGAFSKFTEVYLNDVMNPANAATLAKYGAL